MRSGNSKPCPQLELPANNPRGKANVFSRLFYMYELNRVYVSYIMHAHLVSWLDPLFWIGYTRELKQEDLYATPKEARSQHLLEQFNKYNFNISVCI